MEVALNDSTLDLEVADGDFAIAPAEAGHARNNSLCLLVAQGEFRAHPLAGVGIVKYLNEEDAPGLPSEIRTQLAADGYEVLNLVVKDNLVLDLQTRYINA